MKKYNPDQKIALSNESEYICILYIYIYREREREREKPREYWLNV